MRTAVVALAGLAVLASCAPQPEQAVAGRDEQEQLRRGRDRDRRPHRRPDRQRPPSTTTTAPARPTTTVPSPSPTVPSPTTTAPSTGVRPLGPSGTWKLRFADEFDGSSLDLTKWRPNWFGSSATSVTRPINDYEDACYDPAQVKVSGGMLHLSAVKLSSPKPGCTTKDGRAASYASGMVMGDDRYNFTHGYIEARINLPGRNGVPENWAAFWANGETWPRTGEIDVMETLGGEPRWHFHYESGGQHRSTGSEFDLLSSKTGWHTFGALWEPGKITFYYDGKEVGSTTSGVTSAPMYMILNHGLSNYISGPIVAPSTMQVDYVRHWQR
jgi:beta-glucanase (GH16 family)